MKTPGLLALFIALAARLLADEPVEGHQFGVGSLGFGVEGGNPELKVQPVLHRPDDGGDPKPRLRAATSVLRELTKEYRYEPKLAGDATPGLLGIVEPKVVRMDPVVVTAPGRARELESDLRQRAQALKARRFTLLNGGGTLLEHKGRRITSEVRLKLISVSHGAGFGVFSFSW